MPNLPPDSSFSLSDLSPFPWNQSEYDFKAAFDRLLSHTEHEFSGRLRELMATHMLELISAYIEPEFKKYLEPIDAKCDTAAAAGQPLPLGYLLTGDYAILGQMFYGFLRQMKHRQNLDLSQMPSMSSPLDVQQVKAYLFLRFAKELDRFHEVRKERDEKAMMDDGLTNHLAREQAIYQADAALGAAIAHWLKEKVSP